MWSRCWESFSVSPDAFQKPAIPPIIKKKLRLFQGHVFRQRVQSVEQTDQKRLTDKDGAVCLGEIMIVFGFVEGLVVFFLARLWLHNDGIRIFLCFRVALLAAYLCFVAVSEAFNRY